jgi:hypothetical protein
MSPSISPSDCDPNADAARLSDRVRASDYRQAVE